MGHSMEHRYTSGDAKLIAEDFVKHHHSISEVKEPELKGDAWLVEITVSFPESRKFQVKVSVKTGFIQGF